MEFKEAKEKFISTWGNLGSLWGINKAMAQIHALLFVSPAPLSMEDIMEALDISRGNASMNLRGLIDWGIVYKVNVAGERKEYFTSEKDVTELSRQIAKERSRRELQPTIKILKEVSNIPDDGTKATQEFIKQTKAMHDLADMADTMMHRLVNQEQNWITKTLVKFLK
ncbi:MAG: transcriptional regulator [Flavobacteriaceae bacterium]|jgi:DNA-binding transcriptional regulator GbsR (MarR family)|nr:transcriptional regulator [Flavobacteriaceae bacterium]MAM30085.1 transcriptional regulator [Flavobacteriaceae bacterium]MAY53440.1 transcriptional regulator [Flavobacteriaceae bacterium]|tara:strand:+ start:1772 stop:2275 length:504 start_codon:yes stop_codon:yes gene_type:complete